MSTRYAVQLLTDYGLSREAYMEIVAAAHQNACAGYDARTGEANATAIAEAVAHELNHSEWLDDETHPLWDVAAGVAMEHDGDKDCAPVSIACQSGNHDDCGGGNCGCWCHRTHHHKGDREMDELTARPILMGLVNTEVGVAVEDGLPALITGRLYFQSTNYGVALFYVQRGYTTVTFRASDVESIDTTAIRLKPHQD